MLYDPIGDKSREPKHLSNLMNKQVESQSILMTGKHFQISHDNPQNVMCNDRAAQQCLEFHPDFADFTPGDACEPTPRALEPDIRILRGQRTYDLRKFFHITITQPQAYLSCSEVGEFEEPLLSIGAGFLPLVTFPRRSVPPSLAPFT